MIENKNKYNEELYSLKEKRRTNIIQKSSDTSSATTQVLKNKGTAASTTATTDANKKTNPQTASNSNVQQKNNVYQEKPKVLLISDYSGQKKDNTLIKNYLNNSISTLVEMHPQFGQQLFYRRTPYLNQKYNDKMGIFMQNLRDEISLDQSKLSNEMKKELFDNPITNQPYDNFIFAAGEQIPEGFMNHNIRKQIFCLGETFDEITDSFYQNSILVMDNYNLQYFNPAVLSVSYANMKVFDKSASNMELPKVTFIQLGMNEQEMNKKYLYFNALDKKDKRQKEVMANIQYINMFHQPDGTMKQNLLNKGSISNSNSNYSFDSSEIEFGNWEPNSKYPNCIDIPINAYLEDKKIKEGNDKESSLFDAFNKHQEKCPKIIGSSEFLYLFEQVMKLVRNHKPNIILFAYDFSFTKAHNHYYDLKPDILGYFSFMLSQISNHHVIFIANTKYENHLMHENFSQEKSFFGLDGNKSLFNYMGIDILQQKNQNLIQFQDKTLEMTNKINEDDTNKLTMVQQGLQQQFEQAQQITRKKLEDLAAANQSTNTLKQAPSLQKTLNQMPDILMNNNNKLSQEQLKKFSTVLQKIMQNFSAPSKQIVNYYLYLEEKVNTANDMQSSSQEVKFALDILLHSLNLYQCIQDQFFAVFFGLLEVIDYRKLIQKYSSKTGNHVEHAFMMSLSQIIRRSILPKNCNQIAKESMKGREKNKWNMTHIKVHNYITKIKQIKHIADFAYYSNKQKIDLLMDQLNFKGYTIYPSSQERSIEDSMIINIRDQKTSLVQGLSKEESDRLFSDELKVKIMLKRYTLALLNNWVFDLRRNKKIYLNVKTKGQTLDGEFKFFFTEQSQYIIDYEQDATKIIIYFFNVQRGKIFKNFILTEIKENIFLQEEIIYKTKTICDFMWKKFKGVQNLTDLKNTYNFYEVGDISGQIPNQQDYETGERKKQQQKPQQNSEQKTQNNSLQYYVHQENLENLQIFNSSLCLSENYVVRMFGEIINPSTWKQKEYSLLIFTLPRKREFIESINEPCMRIVNTKTSSDTYIYKSIPRSGCTCISIVKQDPNKQGSKKNIIIVFGGLSYNGYMYNVVEYYTVSDDGILVLTHQNPKSLSQKIFRPLFSPFTFMYEQDIYFFGGDYSNNFISRALDQVYFQKYSLITEQFIIVQPLNIKDIQTKLTLKAQDQKKYQEHFLSYAKKISYTTTNYNQYNAGDQFRFAMTGKINAAIEQILEKTTLITLNLKQLLVTIANNRSDPNKQFPDISCETIIEDEKSQELRLCEFNSSKTFFISVFSADQSTFGSTNSNLAQTSKPATETAPNTQKLTQAEAQKQIADQDTKVYQRSAMMKPEGEVTEKQDGSVAEKQDGSVAEKQDCSVNEKYNFKNVEIIDFINKKCQGTKFDQHIQEVSHNEVTIDDGYTKMVNRDYHYPSNDEKTFYPKYLLCSPFQNKIMNLVQGDSTPQLTLKFQVTLRLQDEDFKDTLLSNSSHFITYNVNFQKQIYTFYKTISLEESLELSLMHGQRIKLTNGLYKAVLKFGQQKLTALNFSPFDEEFEMISQQYVNRYITCDSDYIYLLNGTDQKEQQNEFNQLSLCERVNIKTKISEQIDPCIFLDNLKCHIVSNESYIFYIGLFEIENKIEEEGSGEDDESQQEIIIAQVYAKSQGKWKIFRILNKELQTNFYNYQFVLGNMVNKLFAINNRPSKNKKEILQNLEITFDLLRPTTCINLLKQSNLQFNWQGLTKIQIIPSLYFSSTVYTVSKTNFNQFQVTSMIPMKN